MRDNYAPLKRDFMIYNFMNMQILATDGSLPFAEQVYAHLCDRIKKELEIDDISFMEPLGYVKFEQFANGEVKPEIETNVRRSNVYVIHQFTPQDGRPDSGPHDGFMKLYILDEALRNSSPAEINYLLPFIPYLRQDRIDSPRAPITARRVLKMIADPDSRIMTRIVTFDMHAPQEQGFTSTMMDHLFSEPLYYEHFMATENPEDVTFVSPDAGGTKRTERFANLVGARYTSVQKSGRYAPNEADALGLANPEYVEGKKVIITDDMVDTAGSAVKASKLVKNYGATSVEIYAPHPILSKDKHSAKAEDKLRAEDILLTTTDGLLRPQEYLLANADIIRVKSLTPLSARAVYEIQRPHGSVSKLFRYGQNSPQ